MTHRAATWRAMSLFALAWLSGCDDPAPRHTTNPIDVKQEVVTRETILDAPTAKRLGYGPREDDSGLDPAKLRKVLKFDRPENWVEVPPSEFRHLNFAIASASGGAAECYLTMLPGGGTGVRANVDRWRGQFSLEKLTDAEFATLNNALLLGREAVRVDLVGDMTGMGGSKKPGYAMTAMFAEFPNFDVTLKLVGPRAGVGEEAAHFDSFVRSLAFDFDAVAAASDSSAGANAPVATGSGTSATPPAVAGVFDPRSVKWSVPAGWTVGTGSSVRLVTLDVPGGAQCWITPLPGESGGLLSNLNRWRNEMGQAPLTASEVATLPTVNVLGVAAPWLDLTGKYQGMGGPKGLEEARLFALGCARPDVFLSVKMVGPPAALEAQKANFLSFCQSIEGGS